MSFNAPPTRYMTPPPVYDSPQSTTTLKPYLQLSHILSLTWLAYPILSLLFVAFRLQLSNDASQAAVANAKGDLLASCSAAERAATAAASMPRYMAIATNQQFADAVNGSMNAAREALVLALTVMEVIINFIVDIYRSTFLCFLELVVRGALGLLIGFVSEINSFLSSTFSSLRTSIQNDVSTANSAITTAINAINKVNPFGNISAPQISIPSLDALSNVTLPSDFTTALQNLNNSLPTVSDLKDKVDALLDTPFEALKADINETFIGLNFDASVLPVPVQNTVSFCDQLDTSIVDDLGRDLLKAAKIALIIVILLILVLLVAASLFEWYKWFCLQRHLAYTRDAWRNDPTIYHAPIAGQAAPAMQLTNHNLMMLQANGQHPLLMRMANAISARLRMSPSQHIHLSWFFHYVFHPPAMACFLIGFFGLLSVQLQLMAVGPIEAKYQAQSAGAVSDFSNTIAASINASMYNQSSTYANDVNSRVDVIQNTINNGLFGWVNGTTTTLNNSLNAFYDDIQNTVTLVFNGTVLESPAQEFIKCFLGSKVDALEEALTFLNQNLNVQMPTVNESILVLSPDSINEVTQPIATAAIGGGNNSTNPNEGLVGRLVNTYVSSLKKERLMFAIFMGLWGVVVLMALAIIWWHSYGQQMLEKRRRKRWQREQRVGLDDISVPVPRLAANVEVDDEKAVDTRVNLRSLTPLPEPKSARSLNPFTRTLAPTPVPLTEKEREEKFDKSLDSFLDHDSAPAPRSNKLFAIGRKSMGKERFIGDYRPTVTEAEEKQRANWLNRMKTSLFNNGQSARAPQRAEEEDADPQQIKSRLRPYLTISIASAAALPPAAAAEQSAEPASHWSSSPTPKHTKPWLNLHSVPKVPRPPPGLQPLRPEVKRKPSVPVDVLSPEDDSTFHGQPAPAPVAIPLHYGGFDRSRGLDLSAQSPFGSPFDSPFDNSQPTPALPPLSNLAAPRDWHRRSTSVPAPGAYKYAGYRDASGPVMRSDPRKSSNAVPVNPFSTPFDDDARVNYS
ncbi:hypothetical protein HWV62_20698 [Athelia sp. TMB]|nr:hypothetical protein HWV62_20698 [Athelia sp. TMB]